MKFTIRPLQEKDCALIGPLIRKVWLHAYKGIQTEQELLDRSFAVHTSELIRKEIDDPTYHSVVAEVDGEIVGHARSDLNGDIVDIARLYLLKEFYGQGIGKALLQEVEQHFDHVPYVHLEVFEDNQRAYQFYLSQGYEVTERATEVQSEGNDVFEFKMRKKLRP